MLNVQIDSIDRKKRSVAIKRSESIKVSLKCCLSFMFILLKERKNFLQKKHCIEIILQNKKLNNASQAKNDQPSVLIEYCGIDINDENVYYCSPESLNRQRLNGSKLEKDEKSIIEELSTTNAEFKKVNSFLVNEIEQLKKENDFLKVELIKLHMNDSLTSDSSIYEHNQDLNSTASNATNENSYTSTASSSISSNDSTRCSPINNQPNVLLQGKCSNINSEAEISSDFKTPNRILKNLNKQSSTSSASSSSWSISSASTTSTSSLSSHKASQLNRNTIKSNIINKISEKKPAKIDLSRYINDEDDDDEGDHDYDDSFVNKNVGDTDDEFDLNSSSNHLLPPKEFTF